MGNDTKDAHPPQFLDPDMFLIWKKRFEVFVTANYYHLWKYIESEQDTTGSHQKFEDHLAAMSLLHRAIPDQIFGIILRCQTAHDIWVTLVNEYGGDSKIYTLTREFETFKMLPGEPIEVMLRRYKRIINGLKKLGISYTTEKYVAKVLSVLPSNVWNYNKVKSSILERKDFCVLSLDDLFETLINNCAY